MMMAPEIPKNGPRSRLMSEAEVCSRPLRCEYGRRLRKTRPALGALPPKLKAGDGEGVLDFRKILADGGHLGGDVSGVFERGSGGSLDGHDEVSLIFGGDEALGHLPVDEVSETEAGGEQD